MNIPFHFSRCFRSHLSAAMVCLFMVINWMRQLRYSAPIQAAKKTVVIYSGPTSLDKKNGKNEMYLKNLNFFLKHGVTCTTMSVIVDYVIVLTQDVANHYSSSDGLVTKKKENCANEIAKIEAQNDGVHIYQSSIEIIVREDRCYDMESIRIVAEQKDLQSEYDDLVFLNCGMVGPKYGPHSPILSHSHWTQLFTSLLSASIRMSGLSINPVWTPHVQSFLYAMSTDTLQILRLAGNIYDCGGSIYGVVNRYEIGMGRTLFNLGYSIAVPFMNNWEMGKPLVMNQTSTLGLEVVKLRHTDLWREERLRRATSTMNKTDLKRLVGQVGEHSSEDRGLDILPWEFYVFFKASRFVPYDVQMEMEYDLDLLRQNRVHIVPNKCC
ncbi:hypothetical protein ACHAW6_001511 [Cyclotella cf. meneghiniana]